MFGRLSLRYRIALVIFLLEAVMLASVLGVVLTQSRTTAEDFNTTSQQASLELLSNLGVTALLTGEFSDYQLYLQDVQKQPSVNGVVLADASRHVVASSRVTDVGRPFDEVVVAGQTGWRVQPVQSAAGPLGTLAVEFSNDALTSAYKRTRNLALVVAGTGMAIIALVGLVTGIVLTRRLERVTAAVRRFAEGDRGVRAGVTGQDELAMLAGSFDRMADAVAEQENSLRQQREYIELLLNSTSEAIYGADTRGLCTFVNPACVRLLGYASESELIGKNIHELIHHSYADGTPYPKERCRVWLASQQGRGTHVDDEVHWRADGSSFPVEYWSHPMYRDGRHVGTVVAFIDITERRRDQAQLRQFKTTLDLTQDCVFMFDPETLRFFYVNQGATQQVGYTADEMGRMTPVDIEPDFDEASFRALIAPMRTGGPSSMHFETRRRHKDGHDTEVEVLLQYIAPAGEPARFIALVRDIGERKRTEQALRQLNEELERRVQQRSAELEHQYRRSEQILGAATDGFFATDLSGRIVDTNPAFCHMLGYTREELLQRSVLDIRASASAADVAAHIETVRRTGHDRYDTQHLRKDGSPVTVEVSLSQVMFGDEPLLFAFVRDISERLTAHRQLREAKEEAERANRAKSEFLSRMSHELRTPLNAILGFGQLLEIQAAESAALAPSAGQVREILHAGRHLLTLIDEVLDLARVESGNLSVSPEPVALLPLLQDCLTLMRPQAGARGVRLVEPAASCAVHLRADRTRLKQVLLNLLSNAIKYNRADGEVRIGCVHPPACPEGTLRVCVNDTGAGLSPAQQQRLFVPFERLDAEVQQIQGTGIGLALCKRLLELMGGAIGVESSPGAGSSFWVQLPVAPPPAEPPAPALPTDATTPAPAADHQRDVLCIEDNPANLRLIEGIFAGRSDVRLLTAHAPGTGLELARTHGPALILLDINLPDMDGYAVMRCLREHAATRSIPVIAVSANAMSSDLERAKAAGFAAYLTKPLDIAHALRVFDEVLARPPG